MQEAAGSVAGWVCPLAAQSIAGSLSAHRPKGPHRAPPGRSGHTEHLQAAQPAQARCVGGSHFWAMSSQPQAAGKVRTHRGASDPTSGQRAFKRKEWGWGVV